MKRTALLSVLLFLIAIPAFAENPPNYATLKLGAYFPQHDDLEDFDPGVNVEVAVGQYFNPYVAFEFGVGFLKTNGRILGIGGQIITYPILLSIKGVVPLPIGELYVLAGAGGYLSSLKVSTLGVSDTFSGNTIGGQLGVGGNFNLSGNVFLGVEGKYFWAKPSFDISGFQTIDVHIDGIQTTANIGYRF